MFKKVKEKLKGVKRFMEEKIQVLKDILSSDRSKLTLGFILIGASLGVAGVGGGIIASVFVKAPKSI